jgi:hypothetical protein
MWDISWLAEDLLASQEGICSMGLASWLADEWNSRPPLQPAIREYLTLNVEDGLWWFGRVSQLHANLFSGFLMKFISYQKICHRAEYIFFRFVETNTLKYTSYIFTYLSYMFRLHKRSHHQAAQNHTKENVYIKIYVRDLELTISFLWFCTAWWWLRWGSRNM